MEMVGPTPSLLLMLWLCGVKMVEVSSNDSWLVAGI
jgi:hypothetical protein